jgi:cytochrome c-type biogenesis protein CcmE
MNPIRQRRLFFIGILLLGITIASSLILFALKKNINAFLTPSDVASSTLPADEHFRLGGMVKQGSLVREKDSLGVTFVVTDLKRDLTVTYIGVLPDLFREGKGMVAEGHMNTNGVFVANEVLAKHDENYMPKQMAKVLKKNG